jgi:hypothetical protein
MRLMSQSGQKRRFDRAPITSGLPLPAQPVEATHAPQRFRQTLCSVGYVLVCQDQADNVDIGASREAVDNRIGHLLLLS